MLDFYPTLWQCGPMAGKWQIEATDEGIRVSYSDWTTGKDFESGIAPPYVPLHAVVCWVGNQISQCDVIEVAGRQFACYFGAQVFDPRYWQ